MYTYIYIYIYTHIYAHTYIQYTGALPADAGAPSGGSGGVRTGRPLRGPAAWPDYLYYYYAIILLLLLL